MTDTPPTGPAEPVEPVVSTEGTTTPVATGRGRRVLALALPVLTVILLVIAGVLWWQGRQADAAATTAERRTDRAVAARHAVDRRTETVSHAADEPIGSADQVIVSATKILGASGLVIDRANTTDDAFARAVDLANRGNLSGARGLYSGEVADDIAALQRVLDDARATLASAQQAVLALQGQAR